MFSKLAILAIFIFIYGVIAGRIERLPIGGPILFVAFGCVCGPVGLGVLWLEISAQGLRLVAGLALAPSSFRFLKRLHVVFPTSQSDPVSQSSVQARSG